MAYEVTYTRENMTPIKVMFPTDEGCPFIPQSSYSFGHRSRCSICTSINHSVYSTYCTLVSAHPSMFPDASKQAHEVAADLIDILMNSIGFTRGETEQF